MSRSQFQSKRFILRHAWLNLWDERMTTGRINQVAIHNIANSSVHGETASLDPDRDPSQCSRRGGRSRKSTSLQDTVSWFSLSLPIMSQNHALLTTTANLSDMPLETEHSQISLLAYALDSTDCTTWGVSTEASLLGVADMSADTVQFVCPWSRCFITKTTSPNKWTY